MRKVDFFIIGAPKSGTSSMCAYLGSHPNIEFSKPKEPNFFCTDLGNSKILAKNHREYMEECFRCDDYSDVLLGEGSTSYIFSSVAVKKILTWQKAAKFIVMLRNPVDMVVSLFHEELQSLAEDQKSLESAWDLQEKRVKGENLPLLCEKTFTLQYKQRCSIGTQLERVMSVVAKNQLLVILFDDFVSDTLACYENVLSFLGLPSDNRAEFPVINSSRANRSNFVRALSIGYMKYVQMFKAAFGIRSLAIGNLIARLNTRDQEVQPLNDEFRRRLLTEFRTEVDKLEYILQRDLDHWKC